MELHPLAQSFASVAAEYERGRPDYPPAAVGAFAGELGLKEGTRVLDLGAGTGKLSRTMLAAGLDVIAVEPLASLRALLAERIGAERVREGTAEAIPLPDASVDVVTAADAFHWFDHPVALPEIRRVLRVGGPGALVVISMIPDWSGASWGHELGQLLSGLRPKHPYFDGPPWHETVAGVGGFGPHREIRVTTSEPTSPERISDHLASMSWLAALDEARRAELRARIRDLVHAGEMPSVLPQHALIGFVRRL